MAHQKNSSTGEAVLFNKPADARTESYQSTSTFASEAAYPLITDTCVAQQILVLVIHGTSKNAMSQHQGAQVPYFS